MQKVAKISLSLLITLILGLLLLVAFEPGAASAEIGSSMPDHFYTTAEGDIPGYTEEFMQIPIYVLTDYHAEIGYPVQLFRLYHPFGYHFYTADRSLWSRLVGSIPYKRNGQSLQILGYRDETQLEPTLMYVYNNPLVEGTVPVYSFGYCVPILFTSWSDCDFVYTTSVEEVQSAQKLGYRYYGIAWYSPTYPSNGLTQLRRFVRNGRQAS